MILALTEEQKEKIEQSNITVIEFKRRFYKICKDISSGYQAVEDFIEKFIKMCNTLAEKISQLVDDVRMAFETVLDNYGYRTSRRYKVVKALSKCTGKPLSFWWKISYRTKKMLYRLARSCC